MTPAPALPAADVCAVCLAIPEQRGRLDSCCHLFCVPCIVRWASIETKCPLCKERFTKMTPEDASTSARAGPVMEFRETNQGDERPDEAEEESEDEAERYFCDVCRRGRRRGVAVAVRRVRHRGAHVLRRTRVRAAWKMVLRTMPRNGGRVRGSARWWVESTPTTSRGGVARSGHFVTVGWRRRSRADERAQGGSRASRGESASTWGNTSTRGRRRAIGDAQSLGRRRRRSS